MKPAQRKKAEQFLALHHSGKLLILPNIWDVLGARLLEKSGYEAVATASAAVAFANGFNDGQHFPFVKLLGLLTSICASTELPVSADIEKGYANNNKELTDNIKSIIRTGVIGINIEDSITEGGDLVSIEEQCERIQTIRKVAVQEGIPLIINARCDVYMSNSISDDKLQAAIERGKHYKQAGADCFYPILCRTEDLSKINAEIDIPVNVLAKADLPSMYELEQMGISRISLGPSFLKAALTKMQEVALALKNYDGYDTFTNPDILSSSDVVKMISRR